MFIKLNNGTKDVYFNISMAETIEEQILTRNGIDYNSKINIPSNEDSYYLFTNTIAEIVTKIETLNSQKRII